MAAQGYHLSTGNAQRKAGKDRAFNPDKPILRIQTNENTIGITDRMRSKLERKRAKCGSEMERTPERFFSVLGGHAYCIT